MPRPRKKTLRRRKVITEDSLKRACMCGVWIFDSNNEVKVYKDLDRDGQEQVFDYWQANRNDLIFDYRKNQELDDADEFYPFGWFVYEKYPDLPEAIKQFEEQEEKIDIAREQAITDCLDAEFEKLETENTTKF